MFGVWFVKLHEDVFEPVSHPQRKLSHFEVRTSRNRFASSKVIQLQLVSLFGPFQHALGSKQVTGAGVGLVVSATSLVEDFCRGTRLWILANTVGFSVLIRFASVSPFTLEVHARISTVPP